MHLVGCCRHTVLALLFLVVSTSSSEYEQHGFMAGSSSSVLGTLTRVASIVGGDVDMPCDSRPPNRNDSLLLVVWYRDDNPVYSYDTRVSGPAGHWADEAFEERAMWNTQPSVLKLRDVQPRDRATYRCRVDFQVSPTRNYRVALDVIELPSKPVIFDEYGKEVAGVAGPYNEGDGFKLICSVSGGVPAPRVQWLEGDKVMTSLSSRDHQGSGSRSLTLVIVNATRRHLSAVYTCSAENSPLAPPQRTSVRLDLYLRPLSVEILSREHPLSVGRSADLWCKTHGARPLANITWWLDGKELEGITKLQDVERNETQSMLQFTPMKENNGHVLTCRAQHDRFNRSAIIETRLPLNVFYVPSATMHLGANMNPNDIEEGDDVYFECKVDANPPAYKVLWEHNGVLLQHNTAAGVILTGNSNLALRNVSRHQAGLYTCTASNVEGDGRSQDLRMQVVYRPLCKKKEIKLIGAALQEASRVECEVEAFPPPDTFEWTLNNSAGSMKVDPERYTIQAQQGKSVLTYTPVSDTDYGTLACRATNLAGQQVTPCVYTILPATKPDPPSNCTVYNLTHDSLDLICFAGYDGGLHCTYVVEVWANEGLVANSTNTTPHWSLRRLGAKRQLKVVVYAANARGRSEHVSFSVETAVRLAPRTDAQEAWEVNWALGGVLGAAFTIAIILCLALIATRIKHRARDYEVTLQTKNQKVTVQKHCPDDRNPDLIPLSKGSESTPEPPQYAAVVKPEAKSSVSIHSLARVQSPTPGPFQHNSQVERICVNSAVRPHREIVTTRTPLLSEPQESCV